MAFPSDPPANRFVRRIQFKDMIRIQETYRNNSLAKCLVFYGVLISICRGQTTSPSDSRGIPVTFEENRGQFDRGIKFLGKLPGGTLALTEDDIRFSRGQDAVRLQFIGAKNRKEIEGVSRAVGTSNYFLGSDPSKWQKDIPNFTSVRFKGVYKGIDVVFRGEGRKAEYDFMVAPNVDPSKIEMRFEGSNALRLTEQGDLILTAGGLEITHHKPVVFQSDQVERRAVTGQFVLRGPQTVGFQIGDYDRSKPLTIDPEVTYSAIIAGNAPNAVAADSAGNIYVTGVTGFPDFPLTAGSLQNAVGGNAAFVYKLNPSGTAMLYSAIAGGGSGSYSNTSDRCG